MSKVIKLKNFEVANNLPFVLIGGPCQIESLDHTLFMAEKITAITSKLNINFIFKASYDKANRTSANGQRGAGVEKGLEILRKTKERFDCPLVTDVHTEEQCKIAAETVDILQIPAFLCRQTDLLKAAAETGKVVKVKKGQFLAPWDMKNVYNKLNHFGAEKVMLTERGACFGYNNLVVDMRSFPIMAETGCPIIFDATHSVQHPGGNGNSSGGDRRYVPVLSRAAVAVGVAGLFMEIHQEPEKAPSDGDCMVRLSDLEGTLTTLQELDSVVKGY